MKKKRINMKRGGKNLALSEQKKSHGLPLGSCEILPFPQTRSSLRAQLLMKLIINGLSQH